MKELSGTTYDEATDGASPVMPGTYPAHVVGMTSRTFDSGSIVFNLTFRIAEEVSNMNIVKQVKNGSGAYETVVDSDNNPVEVSAAYMKGKTYFAQGVWLTPDPGKGQGWKNRKYKETCENLGISFNVNKEGVVILGEVEEEDIVGAPALVRLNEQEYTNRNGEQRTSFRVDNILPWKDGSKLSADELTDDVPF